VPGKDQVRPLIPNGQEISVTLENRLKYVYALAHDKLNTQLEIQTLAFLRGLYSVLDPVWLRIFTRDEIQYLISGDFSAHDIDWRDWKANTVYNGYTVGEDHVIEFFWEVVMEMSCSERISLLIFATGRARPPLLGFRELKPNFCIAKVHGAEDMGQRLPTVNTCNHMMHLPRYSSKEVLRKRLLYAMESNSGFYIA
jgi:ubiquitin-protein ligase E3 C